MRYGEERVRSSENVKNAGPEKESTAPALCQEPSLDYAKAVRGAVFFTICYWHVPATSGPAVTDV
jgi:hypothetical protein